ncbi:MAG TPA: glycosyltransferase family 4 protein [Myxococcota bacterium]|nr:glycosyltransferase family 4 protein [Myxococcota bacterium]
MRTLFLVRDFSPTVGGVPLLLEELTRLWPGEVRVIALATPKDAAEGAGNAVSITRIPAWRRAPRPLALLLRQISYARALRRTWRDWPFDRIVCGYLATNGPLAWWWRLRRGAPFVVLTYGTELLRARHSLAAPVWRAVLARAELVVTISDPFTRLIHAFAPTAHVRKVPLGCRSALAAALRARPPEPRARDGRRVILSVGRLVPHKGFDVALRALALLRRTRSDWEYLVVGVGPDRARLERLALELDLADHAGFVGSVDDAQLAALYARADLFVMPSRAEGTTVEGFGLVFVEAGSAGVPVIGGRSGGVAEVVHDGLNGFLVDPTDPADLAAKIERLLADPGLARRMGAEGRRIAREVFTFEAMRDAILAGLPGAPETGAAAPR